MSSSIQEEALLEALSADALRMLEAVGVPAYIVDAHRRVRWQNGASIELVGEDIADLMERLEDGEATARTLPHRSKYLLLVIDFLRRNLELHLALVDEVERDFAAEEPSRDRATADRSPVKR